MSKSKVGIIGYGDFTKVMIEALSPYADTIVSSRSNRPAQASFRFGELSEVLAQPIIIPSIPAQFFEEFFKQHSALINPQALVIDVCSVKVRPLRTLERWLPPTCQIIGSHPMFGPASIARNGSLDGLPCALMPVRSEAEVYEQIKRFLADKLNLKIIETTPEQHDREMAYVQGLSHFVGRVMDEMAIPETPLATLAYEDLLDMKRIQGGDSWDLFYSIMHENPYAFSVQAEFQAACKEVARRVDLPAKND